MKKKFKTSQTRSTLALLSLIILLFACEGPDPIYESGLPLMPAGTYEVEELFEGQVSDYELGVHWYKNPDARYYKFCNFSNKRIEVVFILHDENRIQIPPQVFEDEFERFEIFQGSGELTENGFSIMYWARENNTNITGEIVGRLR